MGHKGRSLGCHECSRSHGCDNATVHIGQISARYMAKTETVSKLNLNGAIKNSAMLWISFLSRSSLHMVPFSSLRSALYWFQLKFIRDSAYMCVHLSQISFVWDLRAPVAVLLSCFIGNYSISREASRLFINVLVNVSGFHLFSLFLSKVWFPALYQRPYKAVGGGWMEKKGWMKQRMKGAKPCHHSTEHRLVGARALKPATEEEGRSNKLPGCQGLLQMDPSQAGRGCFHFHHIPAFSRTPRSICTYGHWVLSL